MNIPNLASRYQSVRSDSESAWAIEVSSGLADSTANNWRRVQI